MKSFLQRIPLLLLCITVVSAEPPGVDQSLEFLVQPSGTKFIRWHGKPGRTYFVQVSDPADQLNSWRFKPLIETGNDEPISHQVLGTAEKGFFRLKFSDQPTSDPDGDDFDADGLSNWDEVSVHGTDPMEWDTDHDGCSDREEIAAGTLPLDPALFPVKVTHTSPDQLVANGMAYGHPSGQPLLLYLNKELPASVTTLGGSWLSEAHVSPNVPAPGNTIILPGRKAIAFIPSGGSFKTWNDVANDTPTYLITFDSQTTGIPNLVPLHGTFTITSPEGSAGHGPWAGEKNPGRDYIDADASQPIRAKWSEPLDPATLIPGNVTLVADNGTVIGTTVSFDYGRDANLMTITPLQALAAATRYTVTLGTGFHNLTGKAHAAAHSWSFTTRPVRPAPRGIGPFVTSVSPADFSFGIALPLSISIIFSEDMAPATLIPENIRIRGWLGNVLPGTFTYTAATRTLVFQPAQPFTARTYFSVEFDHEKILNLPASGGPSQLQDTGNSVFSTAAQNAANPGGNAGGNAGNAAPAPTALEPLRLHYTWGKLFFPPGGGSSNGSPALPYIPPSGCFVDIKLTDKMAVPTFNTLPPNADAVQIDESGDIAPATTVMVTPNFVPGTVEAENFAEKKKNGIFILPTAASSPPGMTYLVFRKTPPEEGSSAPDTVEYLGPFGTQVEARCATADGRGPQTLYFVPVPVERKILGTQTALWNLLEADFAKALPGQRMDLTVQDKYLNLYGPPQTTIDTFEWPSADLGKTFKEFYVVSHVLNYQDILPADLAQQEIKFYRTKGGDTLAAKATFQIKIAGTVSGAAEAIGNIRIDQPTSTFDLEIGAEKVMNAPDNAWNVVPMFGLFSTTAGNYSPGVKFNGSVVTPQGWTEGTWNYVQLIKSRRNYTYQGGVNTHRGDGNTLKLDTTYPYGNTYPTNGIIPADDKCSDTPRDPLTGSPPPNQQSTPRTQIEVHEAFEAFIMFQPSGQDSRYVPLRRAKWQWGGTVNSSNNWTPVAGPESPNSDPDGDEHFDHPQWTDNTISDTEIANP
jgi:hypothetical protein